METKINILRLFFENHQREFYIRELSRLLKINHTTVRQQLKKLVKEGYLQLKPQEPFPLYKSLISRKYLNLKLYFNLEKLRISNLIQDLERLFEYPTIVLFGIYAYALDNNTSDIDICLISNINKDMELLKYEKIINRRISLHLFTKKKFEEMIEKNSGFVNNVCNGIVISGQLEIVK